MNFIALLVALALERLFAARLRVRDPAPLLAYARGALRRIARAADVARVPFVVLAVLLPAAAVAGAMWLLGSALHGLAWVAFAAAVLFFALGPRELGAEVQEYRVAVTRGDGAEADRIATGMLEHDARQRRGPGLDSVAEAVFVQALNRLFGVVFWFALLGPFGAIAYRVSDLLRREALLRAERADAPVTAAPVALECQRVHGVLSWAPARLLALTYGLAGSFEESFAGWRRYLESESDHFFDANDRLLVHAGRGALGGRWSQAADECERAGRALSLVEVAFYAWIVALAALTLLAWVA